MAVVVAAATCDRCSSWTGGPRCLSGKPTGGGEPKGDCIGCSATTSSPSSSTLGCAGCGCSLPAEPRLVLLDRGLDAGSGLHMQHDLLARNEFSVRVTQHQRLLLLPRQRHCLLERSNDQAMPDMPHATKFAESSPK